MSEPCTLPPAETLTAPPVAPADRPDAGVGAIPRLARLRAALLDAPYGLCTFKAESMTAWFSTVEPDPPAEQALERAHFDAMRKTLEENLGSGTPQPVWKLRLTQVLEQLYLRMDRHEAARPRTEVFADALAYTLRELPLRVYDDELLFGNLTQHRIGAPIHPDYGGMLLLPELADLDHRAVNPLATTPEQVAKLEDALRYWFHRSVMARALVLADDKALQNTLLEGRRFVVTQFAGISHVTPDYGRVVREGFRGILADVEAQGMVRPLHRAAATSLHAALDFAGRQARFLEAEADACEDAARAAELREMAAVGARVPAEPARTLREGLQAILTAHVVVHQESFQHGVSFGRLDQILQPLYAADVAAGRLDAAGAVGLLGCFLVKAAEQLPLFNALTTEFFSGLSSASGITLGGTDAAGDDATNDLTHLFLAAYDQVRLRQPNLHMRVHPGTPDALLDHAGDVLRRGGGMPALFNDAEVVPALEALGIATEDARDMAVVGCVEWGVPGRHFPAAGAGFVSLPAALLDTLFDGDTPRGFATMDELWQAFAERLGGVVAEAVAANEAIEEAHRRGRPTPLLSALVGGCIESGRDVTEGGAIYDTTGLQGVGLADVADSLASLDALVFDTGERTLGEVLLAVQADFAGDERLRRRLQTVVPRYGEDAGPAETWAARVARLYAALVRQHTSARGGPYAPGFWSMTTHVGFGRRTGALPSGRQAGAPFANGASPSTGADVRGPTASLLATAAVGGPHVGNGLAVNETLAPSLVGGPGGPAVIRGLVRGAFGAGAIQVQFNVLDPATLLDAQRHPERHRGLVVRVSGYSAYFVDLTPEMQDELIARTWHGGALPEAR